MTVLYIMMNDLMIYKSIVGQFRSIACHDHIDDVMCKNSSLKDNDKKFNINSLSFHNTTTAALSLSFHINSIQFHFP